MSEIKEEQNAIKKDSKKLIFMGANKKYFDFRVFRGPYEFGSVIYHKGSLKDAKDSQNRMLAKLDDFKKYNPKSREVIDRKKEILIDAERFYDYRNKVIEAFEDGVFLFKDGFQKKSQICLIKNY